VTSGGPKIIHVVDTASRLAGGLFESVKGLTRAMVLEGGQVTVIAGLDQWSDADRATWAPVPLIEVPVARFADKVLARSMIAKLDAAAPDIVHLHGIWGVGARATAAWARRTRKPFVVSLHGMVDPWAWNRSRMKKQVSTLFWEGQLLRDAAMLHALNAAEATAISDHDFGAPVRVVPNGVSLPENLSLRPALDGRRSLLFIGRLHPKKGLKELIAAWAMVSPAVRDNWRLTIAGWDEIGLLAALQDQTRALGLRGDVEFLGPVFDDAKDAAFRAAGAFILPSYSEGLPMTVLEAWSYALPALISEACNLPNGFTEGAAFEIRTDPPSMAAAMEAVLLDEPRLVAAGGRGRILVEAEHDWKAISRSMMAAYRNIA
jgi:glycosyltransferase involved in cell wall biosynthesis